MIYFIIASLFDCEQDFSIFKRCTGPNGYWGNGGCASCIRAVFNGRISEKRVDGTIARHFCAAAQDYCDTGYYQINAHGLITKSLVPIITHKYFFRKLVIYFGRNCGVLASQICHRCREQCLACEDSSACSVCKGVRMLTRQDGDLLERIAQIFRKRLESRPERNVIASMCIQFYFKFYY